MIERIPAKLLITDHYSRRDTGSVVVTTPKGQVRTRALLLLRELEVANNHRLIVCRGRLEAPQGDAHRQSGLGNIRRRGIVCFGLDHVGGSPDGSNAPQASPSRVCFP
jgi:hypothetical protein